MIAMQRKCQHLVPVFVGYNHLLHNLLYVLIGGFHCAINLWSVWRRVVVFDLELHVEFSDHSVVEVGTNVCDDSIKDTIPIDEVMLNETSHNTLGN